MTAIYRLSLPVKDYQEIKLTGPVISVAPDRGNSAVGGWGSSDVFDLWYEHGTWTFVDDPPGISFGIYIFGTGHPLPWTAHTRVNWQFIGTVVTPSGLVWHVFQGPVKP